MADAAGETDRLFARASAAIAEAERLAEECLHWQKIMAEGIRNTRFRGRVCPESLKIYSPLDFSQRLRPCEPFSNEIDDDAGDRDTYLRSTCR